MRLLESIVHISEELLASFQPAQEVREYLNERISPEMQKEFQLGYFPSKENLSLLTDIIGEKRLVDAELFHYRINYGEKRLAASLEDHNLIMPYKNAYGRIVGIVGRTILSETERKAQRISKYKNTEFKKANHLFGLWRAKKSILENRCVFVVEGQFDYMNAVSAGIDNCVCLGSGSLSFTQMALLSRYTENIVMLLDNDEAGRKGAEKAMTNFRHRAKISIAAIPDGYKDLDQFVSSEGKKAKEYLQLVGR
jgi:DNA primase